MRSFLLLIYLFIMSLQAQEKERILFIGNSFTFYWNLPSQVEQMALEKGLQWEITQTTASGASLRDHWQGNKALKTKLLLGRETFDRVIFQEHSTYPLVHVDTTSFYYNKLKTLLATKTKVYMYSTWMYPGISGKENYPNSTNPIEENLKTQVAGAEDQLLRIGAAFELFASRYPNIELFTDDKKHPSPQGSYLAACVIFSSLSGQPSKGLKRRYSNTDSNGKKIFYSMVEKETARKCQEVADQLLFNK
ncbi:hypothetical protein N9R82_05375 [Flavobacteriaceae bacterium]|nr:hypothetical protein [Flavobacteriaceae bacterium]